MNSRNRTTDTFLIAGLYKQACADAVQEEIYLEEVEEELRIVLLSSGATEPTGESERAETFIGASLDRQLELAIDDLIVCDALDTPGQTNRRHQSEVCGEQHASHHH